MIHMPPRWTEAENAELRTRWLAGESGGEIGAAMKRSRFSILGRVKRMGLNRKNFA